ncbi:MAG: glycoside hydrolase family 18 protein [Parachlamydiaceae bacterium]
MNNFLIFFIPYLFLFFLFFKGLSGESFKIVGYYPDWAIYRQPAFYPKDINPHLLTHINYAFIKVDSHGKLILFDPWADVDHRHDWNSFKPYWGNFLQLKELKEKNPHLKTLFSVGGWTLSDPFSEMARNPASRQNFIRQCLMFCEKYGFDGIDIDWEYPGYVEHKGCPEDKDHFTQLLKELHHAAKEHSPPLLVTIAAPAGPHHYRHMEVDVIHHYLDWINLMGYDFHGPWGGSEDAITNHHSPLHRTEKGDPLFNVESAVNYYLLQGVPSEKLVLGMPLYGRSFARADGLYGKHQGAGKGTTDEAGLRFFSDIKDHLLPHYLRFWDSDAKVPYLYHPGTGEFITYDDEESLAIKCEFIRNCRLGGAMVWELGLDTFPRWDAMKTIYQTLNE